MNGAPANPISGVSPSAPSSRPTASATGATCSGTSAGRAATSAAVRTGWATTGPASGGAPDDWWAGVERAHRTFTEVLESQGRHPDEVDRYLSVDAGSYALASLDDFLRAHERARAIGFTDLVTHWPRLEGVYAGDERVLEAVAARLPGLG